MASPLYILVQLGDPWTYDYVTYNLIEENDAIEVESNVSTSVLVRLALKRNRNPLIFAMVQESLLAPLPRPDRCYSLLNYNQFKKNINKYRLYSNYIQCMLESVHYRLRDSLGLTPTTHAGLIVENGPSLGVYKLPSNGGNYKAKWALAEDLGVDMYSHYYTISYLKILDTILRNLIENPKELEIWIDTSYGQNYVGMAFFQASMQAAKTLSVLLNTRVVLHQYNSEPYIRGATTELRVYRVRREVITPKLAANHLVYDLIQVEPRSSNSAWNSPIKVSSNVTGKNAQNLELSIPYSPDLAYQAAASVFFGAPLLLLKAGSLASNSSQSCGDPVGCFKRLIDDIIRLVDPRIYPCGDGYDVKPVNIDLIDNIIQITYTAVPDKQNVTMILAGTALLGYVANAYNEICQSDCMLSKLNRKACDKICVTYDRLEKVKERYIAGPVWRLVENELHKLKESSNKQYHFDLYKRIYELAHSKDNYCSPPTKTPQFNDNSARIFQAHAGFSDALTCVCKMLDKICFSYMDNTDHILREISIKLLKELYDQFKKYT